MSYAFYTAYRPCVGHKKVESAHTPAAAAEGVLSVKGKITRDDLFPSQRKHRPRTFIAVCSKNKRDNFRSAVLLRLGGRKKAETFDDEGTTAHALSGGWFAYNCATRSVSTSLTLQRAGLFLCGCAPDTGGCVFLG